MSPRTSSPLPSSYDDINEYDCPSGPSTPSGFSNSQTNSYSSQQQNDITLNGSSVLRNNDVTETSSSDDNSPKKNEKGLFSAILLRPLNIPRRVLSSSAVKCASLMVAYSFCISTICCIFFISYLLTFYDDTRKLFRSSRIWAQLRDGVRERIAMMGDDWEELLQKYFDQWDGVDANRNAHLGGGNNNSNNSNATNDTNSKGIPNPKDKEWEEWLKGAVFSFMTLVAGQDATNKFQHSFRGQSPTSTTGGDAGKK